MMRTMTAACADSAARYAVVGLLTLASDLPAQPVQQSAVRAEAPPRDSAAAAARATLPPLSAEAQQLFDQWAENRAAIIAQLRFLQLNYRDNGRAEDAAAIAAHIRQIQERPASVSGSVSPELVNEGLPTRDEPVMMSLFRNRHGDTLTFAIRGRDD